jgi:hypothetical protein
VITFANRLAQHEATSEVRHLHDGLVARERETEARSVEAEARLHDLEVKSVQEEARLHNLESKSAQAEARLNELGIQIEVREHKLQRRFSLHRNISQGFCKR